MRETAWAKLNLALHVRARAPDGYHDVETLFAFVDAGDELTVEPADGMTLTLTGSFADRLDAGPSNLVLRAAEALCVAHAPKAGAHITLDKRLPVASGIGGGSADAAATLRLLARLWKLDLDTAALETLARPLGADVAACVRSETARGEGRGDTLVSQDGAGLAGMPVLLVNPGVAVATAAVFAGWDGIDRGALPIASPLATALDARNDLTASAVEIAPAIGDVLDALAGARLARMSGSGATCFALFESAAARDTAAATVATRHPHWWMLAGCLK